MKFYVAVAGSIGVGKSTLTDLLSDRLGWKPFYEAVDGNPYLADFYANMPRWSFHSQIFFLAKRLKHHRALLNHPTSVIEDRTIYEDAEIFARNLYLNGSIDERDYRTYREMYEALVQYLPPPDLVIYLKASVPTLRQRIRLRGREYEQEIDPVYLDQLSRLYDQWLNAFTLCPVLTILADDLDFVRYSDHMDRIAQRVLDRLQGKEEVNLP